MKFGPKTIAIVACALLSQSCSVPGSMVMEGLNAGMSKAQVRSVMQSHGLKPDDSRTRPPGGWSNQTVDPFAAGRTADEFERKTGQQVSSAELYYIPDGEGNSVINLYYDAAGRLIR